MQSLSIIPAFHAGTFPKKVLFIKILTIEFAKESRRNQQLSLYSLLFTSDKKFS
jgi:hypothetical protein